MTSVEVAPEKEYVPESTPVATFWRQATEGTFYWRLLIPARHLPARVNSLTWADIDHEDPLHRQEGTAVWQFLGDLGRTKFAAGIQAAGVRSLMEVDDNYLTPAPHMPGREPTWSRSYRDAVVNGRYSHAAHRQICRGVDGIIVSTEPLAFDYEKVTDKPIFLCPNSIEPDDWEPVDTTERALTMGYAGSDSHQYDLHLVDRALDWAARKGVGLVKIGITTKKWRWLHEQVPWTNDLDAYRRSLQKIDIGLCPLKRSRWHDGKSDIKSLEYLMAGALPIVQADSPCYRDWVGRVPSASTPKQWEQVVRDVVQMDHDEREAMRLEALDYLMNNKLIQHHIHRWREAVA